MKLNIKSLLIRGTIFALVLATFAVNPVYAQVSIPDIEPAAYANNIDILINAAPQILFWVLIVFLAIAIGVVVIKALNPLSDDSEEKFSEGRKWFQRTGTLFVFPIVLIIVIIIVWSLLGFGNPFERLGDAQPGDKICEIFGGC